MIGQTISQFRITSELGAGGMGVVYEAEDTRLDRTVALKFLPPHLTADDSAKVRFMHEAKAASSLEHPSICSIFEFGETEDGRTFMVMPRYEGQNLADRLEAGPLEINEAQEIFRQVGQGLAKAHSQGIVHRDIKPANIFLTADGHAKILDFGLAKLGGQTKLTAEGSTLGTVAYMSPEQSRGEELTPKSDIWSLGAVFYEMLAGQPAFGGDHPNAVMYAIQQAEPKPLTDLRPEVPEDTLTLVDRMLAKDVQERVDWDGEELSQALGPVDFRIKSLPWYKDWRGAAAALVVLCLAAALVVQPWKGTGPISAIAVLPFDNLSGDETQEYYADGMTGQLISKLGGLRIFDRVISKRSVMQYKGKSMPLAEIGSDLGVQAVVEGSVMLLGDRVQVTAFLLDAARDKQLWTDTFDEPVANIMDIQGRIVMAIAQAVRRELDPAAQNRLRDMGTVNPVAHKACLRGFIGLEGGSGEEWPVIKEYFNQAIAADSTYALAWAGLAEWLVRSTHTSTGPPPGILEQAREAVDRAIELDPDLAEAHMTRGHLLWEHLFEIPEAGKALDRAIELNPSLAYAYGMRAYYFESLGQYEESVAAARKTIELDPKFGFMHTVIFQPLMLAGKYEEALAHIENTRQKFPSWQGWRGQKVRVLERQEKFEEALALFDEIDQKNLPRPFMARKIWILEKAGRRDEAVELFEEYRVAAERDSFYEGLAEMAFDFGDTAASLAYIEKMEQQEPVHALALAPLHGLHGNLDKAFEYLDLAYERKINWITRIATWVDGSPGWQALAEDPRFEAMLKKIGIRG